MSVLRKRDVAAAGVGGKAPVPASCPMLKAYPSVWEFLTASAYPDGGARVPGTLTIFSESGCFKACLNDRDQGISAFVSGNSLTALLVALESGLKDDDLEWKLPASGFKKKKQN